MTGDVLIEEGNHRVRLALDQWTEDPRKESDNASHLIRWDECGRWLYGQCPAMPDEAGPLVWTYREFLRRHERQYFKRCDGAELFARYVRIVHWGEAIVDGADVWYVMPCDVWSGQANIREDMRKTLEAERNEYNAWANGEVYGYVIEERVTWHAASGDREDRQTWEPLDSCYGFIGRECAEEEAREAFAAFTWEPAEVAA